MDHHENRIAEADSALLAAFSFAGGRACEGFDFQVMDRLHAQGRINDPRSRAKSVWLAPEGPERGRLCAQSLFVRSPLA